jgi:antitoxin component of RelBE/YafQ-DinJ toxin-antitoxin module
MKKTRMLAAPVDEATEERVTEVAVRLGFTKAEIVRRLLRLFLTDYAQDSHAALLRLMSAPQGDGHDD